MSEDQMTLEVLPEDLSKSTQSTGTVETSLSETHIATAVEVAAEASLAADSDANRVEAVSETASEMPNTEAIVNADPATPTVQTLETATETTSESLEVAVSDATVQTESSPESAPAKVPFVAKNKTRRPKPGQPKSVQAKKPRVDA